MPLSSKAQVDLATKEIIAFCQTLGYNQVMLRCDNEPSILQTQRMVVQARQAMGLETLACTPAAYQHGNSLAENAIQRIGGLAGSLMHSLQHKLRVIINSTHALWTCCMRHSAWLLNRYKQFQPRAYKFRSGLWQRLHRPNLRVWRACLWVCKDSTERES